MKEIGYNSKIIILFFFSIFAISTGFHIEENIVFSYFEYDGDHFEEDMKKMEQDPITQEWWKLTHPCFCMVNHDYDTEMEQIFDLSDDKL